MSQHDPELTSRIVLWRTLQACSLWGCILFNAPAWLLSLLAPEALRTALQKLPFATSMEPPVVLAAISVVLVLLLVVTNMRRVSALERLEQAPKDHE